MDTTVHSTTPARTISIEQVGDVPELAVYPGLTLPWERVVVERHDGRYVRHHGAEFTNRVTQSGGVEAVARAVELELASRTEDAPGGGVFETLAAARMEGLTLDTAILAALIATRHRVPAAKAVDLAMHEAFDERVKDAGAERARLIEQARRAAQDAEYADDGAVAGVR